MSKSEKQISCCPKPSYPKSKNPSLFSGSGNNPGSLLSPGMIYSTKINNNSGWKLTIVNKKLNIFGKYSGTPGGSGVYKSIPRNIF